MPCPTIDLTSKLARVGIGMLTEFDGNSGDFTTIAANRLVKTVSVDFPSTFPDGNSDYINVGLWSNYFESLPEAPGVFILDMLSGDPHQPLIPANGINLAFDYDVSLALSSSSGNVQHVAEARAQVILEGGIDGSGFDFWEFDTTNNRVCIRSGSGASCFAMPTSDGASGSVLLQLPAGSFTYAFLWIEMEINTSKQGSGTAHLEGTIDLSNFEWICP